MIDYLMVKIYCVKDNMIIFGCQIIWQKQQYKSQNAVAKEARQNNIYSLTRVALMVDIILISVKKRAIIMTRKMG